MGHQDAQNTSQPASPLVVVVDDDPSIVEGLALVLEGWGYDVLTARSLDELAAGLPATTARPALVLADHFLPGGTGADAVEMVRRHSAANVPAIILTGDTTPERQAEATAAGYRLMHKPVLPAPLRTAIEELIRG